jgi:hypothetical protein
MTEKKAFWPQEVKVKAVPMKVDGNNVGTTTWVKPDKTPTLGQFSGTPGKKFPLTWRMCLKQQLFFGDQSFHM